MTTTALTVNVWGGLTAIPAQGFVINATTRGYIGTGNLSARGSLVTDTVLNNLVTAFVADNGATANLYTIGSTTIPALGDSFAGVTSNVTNKLGFVNVLATQAEQEFGNSIAYFASAFQLYEGWKTAANRVIVGATNSKTMLAGTYSNSLDLITADITNVNRDTANWGRDLRNLGLSFSLQNLTTFGLPVNLLRAITDIRRATPYLITQLAVRFTAEQINNLQNADYDATAEENQQLYEIFANTTGIHLNELLVELQVRTPGITKLSDLLDPVKMFPNSYSSLTVPFYTLDGPGGSNKIFELIYSQNSTSVNIRIAQRDSSIGSYLAGILSREQAIACGAVGRSMLQITNIQRSDNERFAIAVANIQALADLPLVGVGTPVNPNNADTVLAAYPGGTGTMGTFTMCDFFGVATGIKYNSLYSQVQTLIQELTTARLTTAYSNLALAVTEPRIAEANAAIAEILASQPAKAAQLNRLWQQINTQRVGEVTARATANTDIDDGFEPATKQQLIDFAELIATAYYRDTADCQSAAVLSALADLTNVAGQSVRGLMRASANRDLLMFANIPVASAIPTELPCLPVPIPLPVLPDDYPGQIIPEPPQPDCSLLLDNVDTTLLSGQYNSQTAQQSVIDCNCDCWNT